MLKCNIWGLSTILLCFLLRVALSTGNNLFSPMQFAPYRQGEANRYSLSVMQRAICVVLPHSARYRTDKQPKNAWWTEDWGTHSYSHPRTKKQQQHSSYSILWTHFITKWKKKSNSESTSLSPIVLSKNLTNGRRGLCNKHDTCSTLSIEGLGVVKGHLNTPHMAYKGLQVTEEMCSSKHNQIHSLSYLSSTWGR